MSKFISADKFVRRSAQIYMRPPFPDIDADFLDVLPMSQKLTLMEKIREEQKKRKIMKYKVGDRVKITKDKTFYPEVVEFLENLEEPYVVTVREVREGYYAMIEQQDWTWSDFYIEGISEPPIPIENRFEILDL